MPNPTRGYSGLLQKRGFTSLLVAQALSVFNNNAYKTILIFYVLTHASRADLAWMVPAGSGLLVMPYVLFSSYAGQIADRVSKRSIIVTMKALEIALMAAATLAVFSTQISLMLGLLFLEGIHSCFLAPAKEGILPEMLADEDLSRANGLLQLTVYSMIVAGPATAGFLVPVFRGTPYLPVAFLIGTALLSFMVSLGITRVPASGYREKFHWNAPGEFLRDFRGIRSDHALFLTVLGIAYFWMLGSVYLMDVYRYSPDLLHLDEHGVTCLNACLSLGIGLGAALAGKLSGDQVELGLVPLGSIGLGIFAVELFFVHHSFRLALGAHAMLGVAGGIFIVPLEAFLQQRAGEQSKGRVIAASNVLTFTVVFLGSGILWFLSGPLRLRPDQVLLTMGILSFGATAYILTILPDFMVRLCLWLLTHTFYRIEVRGTENLPRRGGALLVCNHVSFVDPFLIGACTQRFIRFMMYRAFYEAPGIHSFAKLMGAIPVSDNDSPQRIAESLEEAQIRLREGELVCMFAEGSITRTGNLLRFSRGFQHIMRGLDVPILPIHLDRVWGSIFSYERGSFFFKWPRRIPYPVTLHVGAPLPSQATAFDVRQAVMELGAEAFAHRDATQRPLPQLFLETARRNWRRFAMADSSGRKLSFGRALAGSILFRRLIRRRCENERMIGVLLPPSVPAALVNMGISLSGSVPVNLNYTASADAIDVAIERCELKTIFTSQKVLEKLPLPGRSQMVMMETVAHGFSKADRIRAFLAARLLPRFVLQRWLFPSSVKLDSLATIIFSSGSTGIPKGVMLSHRNIVSNIEAMQQAIKIDGKDCLLGVLPFFHSFGFTAGLWLPAISGFGVIYHTNPLDARKISELCRTYGVTILISTPTFAWEYVRRCAAEDFRSVRLAVVGAEKMKPELMLAFREKFGIDLFEGYGCTELSPVVAVGVPNSSGPRHRQSGNKAGTVGHPLPGVAVRVVSVEDEAILGPDREGMLQVKGPNVMMGYLGDPEKTREVITPEGWYVTGDIARLDTDGFITITDRISRFSKIAGEMVPHLKVEDALHHVLGSSVPSLVVTSVPDERRGERLVVLHTPLNLSVDELLSRLRETAIPKLWVPRKDNFFEIDALPTLGSGKLDLCRVKELALSLAAQRSKEVLALESRR